MLALALCTLKLRLDRGAQKNLSSNMKLSLQGTVAHRNLSFRRFEDECKENFENAFSRPARQTWEMSDFRTKTELGLGSAHHTYNPVTAECQAGQMACARFGRTYTEIGTLHRSLKRPHC